MPSIVWRLHFVYRDETPIAKRFIASVWTLLRIMHKYNEISNDIPFDVQFLFNNSRTPFSMLSTKPLNHRTLATATTLYSFLATAATP